MQRNMARIKVSTELIVKALHWPEGTEIVAADVVRDTHGPVMVIAVEHEDLPGVDEGDVLPEIMPILRYRRESWDFNWNAQVEYEMVYDDMDEAELLHPAERADLEAEAASQ
jgi:hypothetical protein